MVSRLGSASARQAMKLQGVDLRQLLSAADMLALSKARLEPPKVGQRKKPLSSFEHTLQVLTQVLFEEECMNPNFTLRFDESPSTFGAASPSGVAPWAEASSSGHSRSSGGTLVPRRVAATSRPLSRPHTARNARESRHEQASLDAKYGWHERTRMLEDAQEYRERKNRSIQFALAEKHQIQEADIAAFQDEQQRHLDRWGQRLRDSRSHRHDTHANKFASASEEFENARSCEAKMRNDMTRGKRAQLADHYSERLQGMVANSDQRRVSANAQREQNLQTRTDAQLQGETFRELVTWQANRIANSKALERQTLKAQLDEPPTFYALRYH